MANKLEMHNKEFLEMKYNLKKENSNGCDEK